MHLSPAPLAFSIMGAVSAYSNACFPSVIGPRNRQNLHYASDCLFPMVIFSYDEMPNSGMNDRTTPYLNGCLRSLSQAAMAGLSPVFFGFWTNGIGGFCSSSAKLLLGLQ